MPRRIPPTIIPASHEVTAAAERRREFLAPRPPKPIPRREQPKAQPQPAAAPAAPAAKPQPAQKTPPRIVVKQEPRPTLSVMTRINAETGRVEKVFRRIPPAAPSASEIDRVMRNVVGDDWETMPL